MNHGQPNTAADAAVRALGAGAVMKAERLARRGLKETPGSPRLLDVLWRALAAQDRHVDAADVLSSLVETGGASLELRIELAKLHKLAGRAEQAEAGFRHILKQHPDHAEVSYFLAYLLRDRGAWEEARKLIAALAASTDEPKELFRAAVFLESIDGFEETATVLERLLARNPDDSKANGLLAKVREQLGEFDAALACYRKALDGQREFPGGWLRLTWIRKVTDPGDPDLGRLEKAARDGRLSVESRACARFALGKAYDDLRNHRRAFREFQEGNSLWRTKTKWSREKWDRYVQATLDAFPSGWSPALLEPAPAQVPVFIVGMLRSGTTLMERLLSERPEIVARGELVHLPNLIHRSSPQGYPQSWLGLPEQAKRRVRDEYLKQLIRGDEHGRAFIDKSPTNFRFIGPILELFPNALIVHMRRDPRDVGLSLFFQPLEAETSAYSFDLDDIVHFFRGYRRMMAHWRGLLGARFVEADYEAFVDDPAPVLHELDRRIGLEPREQLESGGGRDSSIRTASVWQARQPVHRRSVARWRAYEPFAPDFFRALGELSELD